MEHRPAIFATMSSGKIYFASDFHLGINGAESSALREKRIIRWLDHIEKDADVIYLVGDLFDYWFEYRSVVPRGFVRLLGKLASIRDKGIPIHVFTGNHDMWMFDYLQEEIGVTLHKSPVMHSFQGKQFYIAHGDGLGPGDHGYKLIKRIFAHPLCQWLFARIHPNSGIRLMKYFSGKSRAMDGRQDTFLGPDGEWLIQFCEETIQSQQVDFFIFGHRHLPLDYTLSNGVSRYINLGDWLQYYTYAVFDGESLQLLTWEKS